VHWQLRNFGMLIGTDQLVFSSAEHPAMTLQLCDMARPLRPLTILDFWLDNLMANIPELCVCGHVDGAVKGYQARAPHPAPHPPPPPPRPPPPMPTPPPPLPPLRAATQCALQCTVRGPMRHAPPYAARDARRPGVH